MTSRGRRAFAVLLVVGLAGCREVASTDLGPIWHSGGAEIRAGGWLTWSADGGTVFWVGPDEQHMTMALLSMRMASGAVMRSLPDIFDFPAPQVANDDRTIFFTKADANSDSSNAVILLRAPLTGGLAGEPVELARDVFRYLASPDGRRVVVERYDSSVSSIDVATGAQVALGKDFEPTSFSPDGTRVLMRNEAANDPSEHYVLIDPVAGGAQNVAFPNNDSISVVLRWDGNRPRVVVGYRPSAIDLVSGDIVTFGFDALAATDGDPAAAQHAYGWTSDCIDQGRNPETGDAVCGGYQLRLFRSDVTTGVTDLVGAAADVEPSIAVSRDGRRLAALTSPHGDLHVEVLPAALR